MRAPAPHITVATYLGWQAEPDACAVAAHIRRNLPRLADGARSVRRGRTQPSQLTSAGRQNPICALPLHITVATRHPMAAGPRSVRRSRTQSSQPAGVWQLEPDACAVAAHIRRNLPWLAGGARYVCPRRTYPSLLAMGSHPNSKSSGSSRRQHKNLYRFFPGLPHMILVARIGIRNARATERQDDYSFYKRRSWI